MYARWSSLVTVPETRTAAVSTLCRFHVHTPLETKYTALASRSSPVQLLKWRDRWRHYLRSVTNVCISFEITLVDHVVMTSSKDLANSAKQIAVIWNEMWLSGVSWIYVYVWLPWLRFFHAFSSVVRQMPRYYPQRQGTARTLTNFCVVLYIVCFVSFCVLSVCICVLYYCHRVATQLQLTSISYICISGSQRCK